MELKSNTVLITGGSSGIGLGLAERFIQAGSQVLICGRREDKLREAKSKFPSLQTRVCDVGRAEDRLGLYKWATGEFPNLNVIVNNAGIQRRVQLAEEKDWAATREEIAINFEAAVHLCELFIPHLLKRENPYIINVTSGLAFVPMAMAPVYCATKAALHSFTLTLRHQLSKTPVRVIEIAPPAVDTDLGGPGLHTFGTPLKEFIDGAVQGLQSGEDLVTYGYSAQSSSATLTPQFEEIFKRMNP